MAGGTQQILGLGTSAAPLSYVVAASQVFDLLAVQADFNGSGAAGSFVPVVEIVSDAGEVMARGVGSTVLAGSSASVTFAPFLKPAAVAATPGVTLIYGSHEDFTSSVPTTLLATTFATWTHTSGGTLLSVAPDPTTPTIIVDGLYSIECNWSLATVPTPNATAQMDQTANGGVVAADSQTMPLQGSTGFGGGVGSTQFTATMQAGTPIRASITSYDTAALTFTFAGKVIRMA